jgi:hypothetical protein
MRGRLFAVGAIAVGAVALVGLSAAATMTARSDAREPAKRSESAKRPVGKAVQNAGQALAGRSDFAASPKSGQSAKDVADYWTPSRMQDARPMEKTVPGGSPSASPTPNGGTAPAGTSTKSTPAAQSSKRDAGSEDGAGEFASGPKTSSDPAEYWTQDKMDRAQPMEKTIPGGDGSGGASAPPGGSVGAGIP